MSPKARLIFDNLMSRLPASFHRSLLKSYANQPELSLRSGFRCFPQNFYSPLVNPHEIHRDRLGAKRELPGIQIDMNEVFRFVERIRPYCGELSWMERLSSGDVAWHETYTTLDSTALYCTVRALKPKRFIEVGCGKSSAVSSEAIRRNESEGHSCFTTFIEPYPGPRLDGVKLAGDLLVERIENVPLSYFQELNAGDILFIDTSHVIKCQNDVEYELLHILPSLKSGVVIHIHDIYTPYDQPADWLLDRYAPGGSNEQYAVECLLSGGDNYQVLAPLFMLGMEHREKISEFMGSKTDRGQAFWLIKR